jgi:uncharacterized protein (UPF0210 family)
MKIRSITCFLNPGWPLDKRLLEHCAVFSAAARLALESSGYEVQTVRLATIPFPYILPKDEPQALSRLAVELESVAQELGIQYVSLGPALPKDLPDYALIPSVIGATQNTFLTGLMTTVDGGISLPAVHACAEVIHKVAALSSDGFANLRFAALANVPAGTPFFPAAYSTTGQPAFALALESADLAVEAISGAVSLKGARSSLIEAVQTHAAHLSQVCQDLESRHGFAFDGLDFTLAPFPLEAQSIGTALERLGLPSLGMHGSLAAVAFLADTLDRARFQKTGFNGLMLPVLEDAVLARRAEQGLLDLKDLLLLSTVCGTGLDTVPLAGDVSVEHLYALLLDLAALALRADKPLTARLMPIPGKQVGEPTGFNFAFFANSRVMRLEAAPLGGLLKGDETVYLERARLKSG